MERLLDQFVIDEELELEACIRMPVGLPFEMFKKLLDAFTENARCAGTTLINEGYTRYIDVFEGDLRTRCMIGRPPLTMRKTRVDRADYIVPERPGLSVRLNLKREAIQETPVLIRTPSYVRVCERWKFVNREMYIYDFTKVSSGTSKASACENTPSFELEIEVLRSPCLLEDRPKFVRSFVSKILDVCGKHRIADGGIVVCDELHLLLV